MRTFYLSLAVLALTFEASDAIGSSGLLRERNEQEHRQLSNGKSGTKGSKGKGKSSSAASPVCPDAVVSKSKGGKGGKGKSKSDDTRFLEEVSRQLSKGKGKGKSSGGGDECCDYPTDLCEDEPSSQIECENPVIMTDTVLSTSLGCDVGGAHDYAVIVDGATLECTGDGENMIYNTGGPSAMGACVILRNGATLKNCHIYNCPVGVVMEGMGNNRVVGSTFFGNAHAIVTGSTVGIANVPREDPPHEGCYSVECSKIAGTAAGGVAAVYLRHGGNFIMSNTDILGTPSIPLLIIPEAGYTLNVALEDVNIFGTQTNAGTSSRSQAIQIGETGASPAQWGTIGEIGFYGTTKLVAHRYGILQDSRMSGNTAMNPATVVVYGGIESYDMWTDGYQFMDAAVMFEDGSSALSCTFGQNVETNGARDLAPDGVSFDIQNTAGFMDLGADITCPMNSLGGGTQPAVCAAAGAGTCPGMPSIALTCAGSSGTSKSKGGKGGKGGKGKSKSP